MPILIHSIEEVKAAKLAWLSRPLISADQLRDRLRYDPDTGVFRWRVHHCSRAKYGAVAGTVRTSKDGRTVCVAIGLYGRLYQAHRLVWLYVHDRWPPRLIDHRDGDPTNNRLANLRLATNQQNSANTRRFRNNTSGFKGVTFNKKYGTWRATIRISGKTKQLGTYPSAEQAHAAYRIAAAAAFGEYANPGNINPRRSDEGRFAPAGSGSRGSRRPAIASARPGW